MDMVEIFNQILKYLITIYVPNKHIKNFLIRIQTYNIYFCLIIMIFYISYYLKKDIQIFTTLISQLYHGFKSDYSDLHPPIKIITSNFLHN